MAEFASKAAEKAAEGLTAEQLDAIEPTGKDGKLTKGDVEAVTAPSGGESRLPVEHVRPGTQAWTDPHSGVEVMLNGGVPPSGARIVDADGDPITTPLVDGGEYFAEIA